MVQLLLRPSIEALEYRIDVTSVSVRDKDASCTGTSISFLPPGIYSKPLSIDKIDSVLEIEKVLSL
jgi:hypothetical protein